MRMKEIIMTKAESNGIESENKSKTNKKKKQKEKSMKQITGS